MPKTDRDLWGTGTGRLKGLLLFVLLAVVIIVVSIVAECLG